MSILISAGKVYASLVAAATALAAALLGRECLDRRSRRRRDERIAIARAQAKAAPVLAALAAEHEVAYLDFLEDQFSAERSEH